VLRLVYGNQSFLFMGDAEGKDRDDSAGTAQYVEQHLLANHAGELDSTVLKISRHSS
jgi:beta-lactamase superfamily II metal-dependent hydrolase